MSDRSKMFLRSINIQYDALDAERIAEEVEGGIGGDAEEDFEAIFMGAPADEAGEVVEDFFEIELDAFHVEFAGLDF